MRMMVCPTASVPAPKPEKLDKPKPPETSKDKAEQEETVI
jgi:hypothetical protein